MNLENNGIFFKEIREGHRWQLWAGFQFLTEGFIVQVPVLKIRPNRQEIDSYTDEGDIYIWRNNTKEEFLRFECKSRNLSFTTNQDYPFPTAFVDRVNTWRRKAKKVPAAILLISQVTGVILAIPTWTQHKWFIKDAHDSVRGYRRQYYMVQSAHLVNWDTLISQIKGQMAEL